MSLHPLFAAALAPFAPHDAYGRCPHGHVQGRYDVTCLACERKRILDEPRAYRVTIFCDCHKPVPNGMALPDPDCEKCGGTGECDVTPF